MGKSFLKAKLVIVTDNRTPCTCSTVFVRGELDAKCHPSGNDFYDFSRANFSIVNAAEGHVRAGMLHCDFI